MSSGIQISKTEKPDLERVFCEFRRKVRDSELLSASLVSMLHTLQYSGRICIIVQNGRILKSGYEESYFRSRGELMF
jgi:hypothetical protein